MPLEQERRDDTEVAAAAADRPEEVRILLGAGGDQACRRRGRCPPRAGCRWSGRTCASGGPMPPPSVRPPTPVVEMIPEGTARPKGAWHDPRRPRARRRRRGRSSSSGRHGRSVWREIDDQPVVADAEAAGVVAAAANRHEQLLLARELHRRHARRRRRRSARSAAGRRSIIPL